MILGLEFSGLELKMRWVEGGSLEALALQDFMLDNKD